MTGNVWEWLTDWNNNPVNSGTWTDPYCALYTAEKESANPSTMSYTSGGVLLKGASFKSTGNRQVDYNGNKNMPYNKYDDYGFRICRNETY